MSDVDAVKADVAVIDADILVGILRRAHSGLSVPISPFTRELSEAVDLKLVTGVDFDLVLNYPVLTKRGHSVLDLYNDTGVLFVHDLEPDDVSNASAEVDRLFEELRSDPVAPSERPEVARPISDSPLADIIITVAEMLSGASSMREVRYIRGYVDGLVDGMRAGVE